MTKNSIAISGSTGWLGCEAVAKVLDLSLSEHLDLYSSNGRDLNFKRKILPTKVFLESTPPLVMEGFLHLAFLTREKVTSVGFSDYVSANISLISKACNFIESSKPNWVVLVSSGAVLNRTSGELENDVLKNPYGFCKRIEESLISQSAHKVGANVVIGRLWGATGEHMPQNSSYALSDFIESAHSQKRILINSGGRVYRRYVDAGEFIEVLIKAAMLGENIVINSGGPKIEIGDLAMVVSSHFSDVEIERSRSQDRTDDYYPRDENFEELALRVGANLSDIETQVSRTVKGHLMSSID